ncbi:MAG: NADH-quinone oxidoreductase subunit L [Bacteroidetes bacterium]|nr:MAG: NADH-quinone oxidoreductase subunit L [Bacteroidota bacterium]
MRPELTIALAVLLLPLASFTLLIFTGRRYSERSGLVGTAFLGIDLLLALYLLAAKVPSDLKVWDHTFTWIDFHTAVNGVPLKIDIGIMVDDLTAVMLVVVTLISFLVHLFSLAYMKGDVRFSRYYANLGIFTFSMLGIVLTNNYLLMYVFWELVGLSSYLLIGHWYEKKSAADASKKAFLVNRVGDLGFFIGIMIVWMQFSTLTFDGIFGQIAGGKVPFDSNAWLTAAGMLIFCGAVGKSAQFPLHVWLPDAMEGPTPVSALIHAATMVAAGVYLTARTFPMLTADALLVIAYVGAVTAFIAATIALVQNDIKKILAYSTVSQLGYMVMGLGVGAYTAGVFHLVTHAAFKAGLFLASGSVIHAMHHALHHQHDHHTDAQDIRHMGGLKGKMPVTFWTMLIFTLAISGVPLTSGFMSKDEILAGTLAFSHFTGHTLIPVIGFLVAGLTAFYMFRMLIVVFLGSHPDAHRAEHLHESPKVMTVPLMVLAALSFFAFYSFNPLNASHGWFMENVTPPAVAVPAAAAATATETFVEEVHHQHSLAMLLSVGVAGLGILAAFVFYHWRKVSADAVMNAAKPVHTFLYNKWFFDELYHATAVAATLGTARALAWFDAVIVDGIVNGAGAVTKGFSTVSGKFDSIVVDGIVNLTATVAGFLGMLLRTVQTGRVQTYIVFALIGLMALLALYI